MTTDPIVDFLAINYASQPRSPRESEEMTIYDVLRHIIVKTTWDGNDFNEENARKEAACNLVDKLEAMGILGQVALDTKEHI